MTLWRYNVRILLSYTILYLLMGINNYNCVRPCFAHIIPTLRYYYLMLSVLPIRGRFDPLSPDSRTSRLHLSTILILYYLHDTNAHCYTAFRDQNTRTILKWRKCSRLISIFFTQTYYAYIQCSKLFEHLQVYIVYLI